MPLAVTHILIPMIGIDFIRDHFFKTHRRKWPNKYIFLVGVAGLLPDIDYPISILLLGNTTLHRTITHTFWFPLAFFIGFFIFYNFFRKAKLFKFTVWKALLIITVGISIHLFLDAFLTGNVNFFYPFSDKVFGLNIIPGEWDWFYHSLDALLLFGWLLHEEMEHNISEYF